MGSLEKRSTILILSVTAALFCYVTPDPILTSTPDVTITATPSEIYNGLTQHLVVNCSFQTGNASDFSDVMSLIVSKSDQGGFKEVAIINLHSLDLVEVKNTSLSAHVTGHLPPVTGDAYLALEWDHPIATDVTGEYQCDAYGMDHSGHPRVSQAALEVTENEVTTDACMSELTTLLTSQANLNAKVHALEGQKSAMTSLLMSATSIYNGHLYLLSITMERNITRSEEMCENLGGYLVEIEDKQEYDFVYTFAMLNNSVKKLVMGVTDKGHEGQWTFIHSGGPAFIYSRVDRDAGAAVNCMELWLDSPNGHLHDGMVDEPCFGANTYESHSQGRFMCEMSL